MTIETRTERGRIVLKVETEQEFEEAFGRALDDPSIDIDAPREMLDKWGVYDAAEDHGLLDETD